MVDLWRDLWIRETGTGQQVAQLHDRYIMMMMKITMMMISYFGPPKLLFLSEFTSRICQCIRIQRFKCSNDWCMMNWKAFGTMQTWSNILLMGVRKITLNFCKSIQCPGTYAFLSSVMYNSRCLPIYQTMQHSLLLQQTLCSTGFPFVLKKDNYWALKESV